MADSRFHTEAGEVYLDELSLSAAWRLLRVRGVKDVIVLEAIKPAQRLGLRLLEIKGIRVTEASFFAGHLKTDDGESVFLAVRSVSGQIAMKAAEEIVRSEPHLNRLNDEYGRNTVRLFIFKKLHVQIRNLALSAMVAQALCRPGRAVLWLKRPTLFDGDLLCEALPGVDLLFYPTIRFRSLRLFISWLLDVARDVKLTGGFGKHSGLIESVEARRPAVLTLQEDIIRADRTLRGQPHWVDVRDPREEFNIYVAELQNSAFSIAEDTPQLSKAGVTILPTSVFRSSLQEGRGDKTLRRVRRDRRHAIRAVFRARGFANKYFLLRIGSLLRQAELMGALALWLNARVFLIRETYYSFADAMQLVAPDLNVTTVAYQYSNMGTASPLMLSTADKLLIFSDMYKALYEADGIAPQEFLSTGYLYDCVAGLVLEKAKRHREALNRAGAKFIVCYFDENVQDDRWGMMSTEDHLGELHALAEAVLSDPTFGVVVKSQFIRTSPSRLYPQDEMIQAARATGRYLELMEGVHRNDIYPTEAALVADLCIGHKFGATAALEGVIAGVRTVLLDAYGTRTLWDRIYSQANIECDGIDSLMVALAAYRTGSAAAQKLGDWRPILHYFDPYRDGKSVCRLRAVLKNAIFPTPRRDPHDF